MDGDRDAELGALDATAQAALVRSGGATPLELVEAACRRIERVDPLLGAVPVRLFDAARESGLRPGGDALAPALAGVPFLMKDVGARQAGQPYYAGNRALRDSDHRAETDTPLGALFREIGLVTVGNSSTPEFGLQSHTWPLAYGPTRNPYDLERAAGGSSGGACAAVAAGLVPVAHASDGAGSIRIPAAWCGLVGLKPSRDRVTWRHAGLELPEVEFVVARSLRDTALLLDLLRADRATAPADAFRAALVTPTGARRVGLLLRSPAGSPVAPECAAAVLQAGEWLARAGHRVERAAPPSLDEYADRALHGAVLGNAEYRACLDDLAARLGRPVGPGDVEPFLWELSRGTHAAATPAELETSVAWSHAWVARTLAWFDAYDLLLTPTVCEPAPRLETLDPHRLAPLEMLERMVPHMAFTEPWNATGQPAITLPLAETADGLPVGVQLVAAPGREDLLLRLSQTLLSSRGEIPRPPHHA